MSLSLDFYSSDDHERLIKLESELRAVEKIINCIQISDPWLQTYALENSMSIQKSIMGRKARLDFQMPTQEGTEIMQSDEGVKAQLLTKLIKGSTDDSLLHLISSVENLGKCYTTVSFKAGFKVASGPLSTLLALDFSPVQSRMKLIKCILNSSDFRVLFKTDLESLLNNKSKLLLLLQQVSSCLTSVKRQNYSVLMIPTKRLDPSSLKYTEDVGYYYYNAFDKYKLRSASKFSSKPFMAQLYKEIRVLHKKVIRVNKSYFVVIVEKHTFLGSHVITLYSPASGKFFHVSLYNYDISKFSHQFSNEAFRIPPEEYAHLLDFCGMNYKEFDRVAENHVKNSIEGGFNRAQGDLRVDSYFGEEKGVSQNVDGQLSKLSQRGRLIDKTSAQGFVETHIWNRILAGVRIKTTNAGKFVFNLDTYSGPLVEVLFKDLFSTVKNQKYWLEVCLEKVKSSSNPYAPSQTLRFEDLQNFEVLVRLKFLDPQMCHNDKMNLKKVYSLFAESQLNAAQSGVTQSALRDLGYFVAHTIAASSQNEDLARKLKSEVSENAVSHRYFFKEVFERRMKTNSRMVADCLARTRASGASRSTDRATRCFFAPRLSR